jgi:hypothetical protein
MLQIIRKFPFFKVVEVQTPPNFDTVIVNGEDLTEIEKKQIKAAKELFALQQIPINKVRFIFDFKFTYDIDKDIVNPKYTVLVPRKKKKDNHPIEIGVPENLMTIEIGVYQTDYDDFNNVRSIIKNAKKGVVIKLNHSDHFSGMEHDILMANLDAAIEFQKNSQ